MTLQLNTRQPCVNITGMQVEQAGLLPACCAYKPLAAPPLLIFTRNNHSGLSASW